MEREFDNRMSRDMSIHVIRAPTLIYFIPLLILGMVFYSMDDGIVSLLFFYLLIILDAALIIMTYFRLYFFSPIRVTVDEGSAVFEYKRILKPRRVTWPEVRHLSVRPGDPSVRGGRYTRGGTLIDRRWRSYWVRYEVATAIRDAYRETMGHDPPIDKDWGS